MEYCGNNRQMAGKGLRRWLVDASILAGYFPSAINTTEIVFDAEPCADTGGYEARWDAPGGGGITTQGDAFGELDIMIADAVTGYFEPGQRPKNVRLHFSRDPILAVPQAKSLRPCAFASLR